MKGISIFKPDAIKKWDVKTTNNDREWIDARPLGFTGIKWRIKCALLVFTGKCDVLKWPGDQ